MSFPLNRSWQAKIFLHGQSCSRCVSDRRKEYGRRHTIHTITFAFGIIPVIDDPSVHSLAAAQWRIQFKKTDELEPCKDDVEYLYFCVSKTTWSIWCPARHCRCRQTINRHSPLLRVFVAENIWTKAGQLSETEIRNANMHHKRYGRRTLAKPSVCVCVCACNKMGDAPHACIHFSISARNACGREAINNNNPK